MPMAFEMFYFYENDGQRRQGQHLLSVATVLNSRIGSLSEETHLTAQKDLPTLHPVTVKRWTELLLNHPRIGPELRARLK